VSSELFKKARIKGDFVLLFLFLLFSFIYRRLLCSPTGPRYVLHSDTSTPLTSLQTVAMFPLVTTGARRYFTGMSYHACIPNLSRFSPSHSVRVTNVVSGFHFDDLLVYFFLSNHMRGNVEKNISMFFIIFVQVESLHGLVEYTTECMRVTVEPTSHLTSAASDSD